MSTLPEDENDERFAFRRLGDKEQRTETYVVSKELMSVIYETLKFYGNQFSYEAERTDGVLAGCPRGPTPTPAELIRWANYVLVHIDREVLHRE